MSTITASSAQGNCVHPSVVTPNRKYTLDVRKAPSLASLAVRANALTRQELDEAYVIAQRLGEHLDMVILRSGYMTHDQYSKCSRALQFIEQGLCTEALAITGLNMACKKLVSFEEGLRYFGWGW